jgi:uncharacterized protein YbjT (DUF2867 family)
VIGELEVELAIADANELVGAGELAQLHHAGIDPAPVQAYARRFAKVKDAAGAPYDIAAAGGFMLGFRLGVLAARHERMDA